MYQQIPQRQLSHHPKQHEYHFVYSIWCDEEIGEIAGTEQPGPSW